MRVRSLRALGVIFVCAMVPLACTSILGDYAIGSAGPTSDGGTDGLVTQETSSTDGDNDASPDAPPGLPKLTCSEKVGSRFLLGSFPGAAGLEADSVFVFRRGTFMRALVTDPGTGRTHVYTYDPGSGGSHQLTETGFSQRLLAVRNYPGGLAILVETNVSGSEVLQIMKLPDGMDTLTAPVNVTSPGALDCATRNGGTFEVIDAATDDYLIVHSYNQKNGASPCNGKDPHIFGRRTRTGALHEWRVPANTLPDAGANGIEFPDDAIAIDGSDVYVIINPSGGPTGTPSLYKTTLVADVANPASIPVKVPTDFMSALGMTSGLASGGINLAVVEGDLTNPPEIFVGQVKGSNLGTLKPSTAFTATSFASLSDLPIDKSRFHWDDFATGIASENLVAIARTLNTRKGANFVWWNGQGKLRAQQTGGAGGLLPSDIIYGVDIGFRNAPFGVLADLSLVFTKDVTDAGANVDVWAADISCIQ